MEIESKMDGFEFCDHQQRFSMVIRLPTNVLDGFSDYQKRRSFSFIFRVSAFVFREIDSHHIIFDQIGQILDKYCMDIDRIPI